MVKSFPPHPFSKTFIITNAAENRHVTLAKRAHPYPILKVLEGVGNFLQEVSDKKAGGEKLFQSFSPPVIFHFLLQAIASVKGVFADLGDAAEIDGGKGEAIGKAGGGQGFQRLREGDRGQALTAVKRIDTDAFEA